jgi:hypothetical protein
MELPNYLKGTPVEVSKKEERPRVKPESKEDKVE